MRGQPPWERRTGRLDDTLPGTVLAHMKQVAAERAEC